MTILRDLTAEGRSVVLITRDMRLIWFDPPLFLLLPALTFVLGFGRQLIIEI